MDNVAIAVVVLLDAVLGWVQEARARSPRCQAARTIDVRIWVGIAGVGLVMALLTLLTIDLFLPGADRRPRGSDARPHSGHHGAGAGATLRLLQRPVRDLHRMARLVRQPLVVGHGAALSGAAGGRCPSRPPQPGIRYAPLSLGPWRVCVANASGVL